MNEKLEKKLIEYDIRYVRSETGMIVKLGLGLEVTINSKNGGTVEIKDKLRGWNLLTGMMEVNIAMAVVLQSIYTLLMAVALFFVFQYAGLELVLGFVIISLVSIFSWGYTILWSMYYHIKAENFKRTVISWLDD